jgi:hypothetical protein
MKIRFGRRFAFAAQRARRFRPLPRVWRELPTELFWAWLWWRGWAYW